MTSHSGVVRDQENTGDSKIYSYVTSLYHQFVSDKVNPTALPAEGGEFHTWAYQHYGRYSFTTPAWWPVLEDEKDKEITGNLELLFLKWAEANEINDVFVPWTTVKHPDFPNHKVEVGGIKPFVMYNPPFSMVSELLDKHVAFVNALTQAAPRFAIIDFKQEALDKDVFRITLTVKNNGIMPTLNQIGERSIFLKFITIQLNTASGQNLLQGNRRVTRPVLNGGETSEFTWLIHGRGRIKVEAGCPTAGFATAEITL